tara:strand:- start:224 stop:1279 length:1056 start_codon:yes stop_codon:yes gene_type:complete
MATNSKTVLSSKTLRTAGAVHTKKAITALKATAKKKGAHANGTNATLTAMLAFVISMLPKDLGKGEKAFGRDEAAKAYQVRAMNSFTGASTDMRLDKRTFAKVMPGIGADKRKELVALISPACPGGLALFEKSQTRAENRAATRFDMFIDAIGQCVVDIVGGLHESAPVNGEGDEDKAERQKRNQVSSAQRKAVISSLGMFPARARKSGNKDKDGNKVEAWNLDYKIISAYRHKLIETDGETVAIVDETKPGFLAHALWSYMAEHGYLDAGTIDKGAKVKKSDGGKTSKHACHACGVTANLAAIDAGYVACHTDACKRKGLALGEVSAMSDFELAAYTKARKAQKSAALAA